MKKQNIYWLKKKVEVGAEYIVTQMFYDNQKYFNYVERAKDTGINVTIILGINPFSKLSQLNAIPKHSMWIYRGNWWQKL